MSDFIAKKREIFLLQVGRQENLGGPQCRRAEARRRHRCRPLCLSFF
jgi:hypothetical protein